MRYILVSALLTALATSVFAQSNTVQITENQKITACFLKAVVIVPSQKIDFLIIIKPSGKLDSGILNEILCPNDFSINRNEKTSVLPFIPSVEKQIQL